MAKGGRTWMQALLETLPEFFLHHVFHAALLIFPCDSHVWIDLSGGGLLEGIRNLVEALEQRVAIKIIVEQHAPQVRMAGKANAIHILGLPPQPVGRWPAGDDVSHIRILVVGRNTDLM